MPDYKVHLDVYNGPLDLLLFLIRRDELDIQDIPIAEVTRQYCDYVACLEQIDPDAAAEFLVMAATLMEIKSRLLLPQQAVAEGPAEDLSDPRMELVRQLLEYKKFKDASLALSQAAEVQAARWPRSPIKAISSAPAAFELDDLQVWDLVAAFNKLMAAIGRDRVTHDVVFDDTPIALHAADIQDRLSREGTLGFEAIFLGRSKPEMIGLFLAMLELIRQHRIRVEAGDGESIRVVLLSADPITIGAEWESGTPMEEPQDSDASLRPADEPVPPLATALLEDESEEADGLLDRLDHIRTEFDADGEKGVASATSPSDED